MELSNRLKTVADLVLDDTVTLADIGSDHAYLPIYLIRQNKIKNAVAGEVVIGPFNNANKEVEKYGLKEQIAVRLGDGLDVIHPSDNIDAITICGMGGDLIASILDRGKNSKTLNGNEQLVLQPNVGEKLLREWLMTNNYCINREVIIEDNKRLYEIIAATKINKSPNYSEKDLKFGVHLLKEKSPLFIRKWTEQKNKLESILGQIQQSDKEQTEKINTIQLQIKEIEEIIQNGNN